jgi:hypothetical protein
MSYPEKIKAYIAGPMRGIPNFNFDLFASLTEHLRGMGINAINPAEHDVATYPDIYTWEGFPTGDLTLCPKFNRAATMMWDLKQVIDADWLVLLPGWERSTGATEERRVAEICGKVIQLAFRTADGWRLRVDDLQDRVTKPAATYTLGRTLTTKQIGAYQTKDSGERVDYPSGMRRDTNEGKPRYDLIPVGPHRRLAELYARGAEKYGDRNWELADSVEELNRFKASAERHFMQWKAGDDDEDHASAVVWNVFAALWLDEKLANPPGSKS